MELLSAGGAAAFLASCGVNEMIVKSNDITIAGSGPVGIAVAIRLAEKGMNVMILEGGAVGTPRLLFNSGIRSEALGKGFSFHALLFGQLVLDTSLASPITETDIAPRLWIPPTMNKPWHIQVLRDTFPVPTTESVNNPHRLLEFQAFLPIEYRDENHFIFSENDQVDVQFEFSDNDRVQMDAVREDVLELATHLGEWRGGGEPNWVPHGTAHLSGTCRMDIANWKGVADEKGRVHGFNNLYIASVDLIPSQVAVNPTLTALALNTVDAMLS